MQGSWSRVHESLCLWAERLPLPILLGGGAWDVRGWGVRFRGLWCPGLGRNVSGHVRQPVGIQPHVQNHSSHLSGVVSPRKVTPVNLHGVLSPDNHRGVCRVFGRGVAETGGRAIPELSQATGKLDDRFQDTPQRWILPSRRKHTTMDIILSNHGYFRVTATVATRLQFKQATRRMLAPPQRTPSRSPEGHAGEERATGAAILFGMAHVRNEARSLLNSEMGEDRGGP